MEMFPIAVFALGTLVGCNRNAQPSISSAKIECGEHVTDPLNVLSHEVRGNLLDLNVDYAGGCEEHVFNL